MYPPLSLLGNVTAVTNTHATIEELLDASFSMWPVSYQGKSYYFFPELVFIAAIVQISLFWHRVVLEVDINVSEEYSAVIFRFDLNGFIYLCRDVFFLYRLQDICLLHRSYWPQTGFCLPSPSIELCSVRTGLYMFQHEFIGSTSPVGPMAVAQTARASGLVWFTNSVFYTAWKWAVSPMYRRNTMLPSSG
jgi:hypothetical protein